MIPSVVPTVAENSPDILIFANPIAGRGRGQSIGRRLQTRLRAEGYTVQLSLERPDALGPENLTGVARAAIVIGGDGTLRSVADRLCQGCSPDAEASTTSLTGPPLLVVPLGTANLMGRHLGIRWEDTTLEEQVSRAISQRRVLHLDAGRANGKLFLLMAGIGFDAAIVHELDRIRTGPISYVDYVLPAALTLGGYNYPPLRVTVDGREVFPSAPAIAFVGNVAEYGTGFPILPSARPDDGLLDVCVLPCRNRCDVLKFFLHATTGEHLMEEGVVYVKGRRVRVESPASDKPVPVQVDGDPAGHTPLDIDLLPVRLPFIVP
jgi:diacylglycerol kinase (ATP)